MFEYTSLPINHEAIKIDEVGLTDRGTYDRAIMVARELRRDGRWDGEEMIVISDPYRTYAGMDWGKPVSVTRTEYGALFVKLADEEVGIPPERN